MIRRFLQTTLLLFLVTVTGLSVQPTASSANTGQPAARASVTATAFERDQTNVVSLNWGTPIGWEIRKEAPGRHRIVFYNPRSLDLEGLQRLPLIASIEQHATHDTSELLVTTAPDTELSVIWAEGSTEIRVAPEQKPLDLTYNQKRTQRQAGQQGPLSNGDTLSDEQIEAILNPDGIAPQNPHREGADRAGPRRADHAEFEAATEEVLPLSPEQIEVFGKKRNAVEQAITDINGPPPAAINRSLGLSLESGAPVETIHLVKNHITTLVFLDATGQPWPIESATIGEAFALLGADQAGAEEIRARHELRIVPNTALSFGNVSISLVDLATPITLRLEGNRKQADFRVDLRLARSGPNAIIPVIDIPDQLASLDEKALGFLSGVIPAGAEELVVDGTSRPGERLLRGQRVLRARAWRFEEKTWLKTRATVLSPAYNSRVGSSDGSFVYSLNDTPVILVSLEGKRQKLLLLRENRHE